MEGLCCCVLMLFLFVVVFLYEIVSGQILPKNHKTLAFFGKKPLNTKTRGANLTRIGFEISEEMNVCCIMFQMWRPLHLAQPGMQVAPP